jgi:hypothetical protein
MVNFINLIIASLFMAYSVIGFVTNDGSKEQVFIWFGVACFILYCMSKEEGEERG